MLSALFGKLMHSMTLVIRSLDQRRESYLLQVEGLRKLVALHVVRINLHPKKFLLQADVSKHTILP